MIQPFFWLATSYTIAAFLVFLWCVTVCSMSCSRRGKSMVLKDWMASARMAIKWPWSIVALYALMRWLNEDRRRAEDFMRSQLENDDNA